MGCSPPGSSVHGILQARVLEWGVIAFGFRAPQHLLTELGSRAAAPLGGRPPPRPVLTSRLVAAVPTVALPIAAPGLGHALLPTGTAPLPGATAKLLGVTVLRRQRATRSTTPRLRAPEGAWVMRRFPGGASGKEPACQCRRHKRCRFDPWVGKIPWRKAWQPTPVFLPGESHGRRSLVGYSPWGRTESDTTERLHLTYQR